MRRMPRCKGNTGTEQGTAREGLASRRGQRCLWPPSPESLRAHGPSGAARTSGHATSSDTAVLLRAATSSARPARAAGAAGAQLPRGAARAPGTGWVRPNRDQRQGSFPPFARVPSDAAGCHRAGLSLAAGLSAGASCPLGARLRCFLATNSHRSGASRMLPPRETEARPRSAPGGSGASTEAARFGLELRWPGTDGAAVPKPSARLVLPLLGAGWARSGQLRGTAGITRAEAIGGIA